MQRVCPPFCPFCLSFSSLVLLSCFRLLSCLASCLACFPALCLVFLALWVGFLSLSDGFRYKKKGRKVFASRPLLSCCGLLSFSLSVYVFSASLSAASFAFENIHPAPQERWLLNLPPSVFRVSLIARVSPTIAIAFSE